MKKLILIHLIPFIFLNGRFTNLNIIGEADKIEEPATEEITEETNNETSWNEIEEYYLQKIAYAEAGNQGIEGMALVMCVVLNRVRDARFPNNICDVISQSNVNPKTGLIEYQFSSYVDGVFVSFEPNEDTMQALSLIKNGWDESQGCTFFRSCVNDTTTWHDTSLELVFQYKDHKFYR